MNATKTVTTCLLSCLSMLVLNVADAQDFSTRSPLMANYGNTSAAVHPAYTAPRDYAARSASYWVERDPRYMPSLPAAQPASYRSAATTAYRPGAFGGYGSDYRYGSGYGGGYSSCGYGGAAPVYRGQGPSAYAPQLPANYRPAASFSPAPRPAYSPYRVPEGYYRGDGIFGKDTVFAENQPVRNFFRYLMP